MNYIGIDPGESGAIAVLCDESSEPFTFKLKEATEVDVREFLRGFPADESFALIEHVHSMPKQGVASSFKFGKSYGFLRGLLVGVGIPFREISPQRWQKVMDCRSGGDKNVTKARAQQLFTGKITHATADAILLASVCRMSVVQRDFIFPTIGAKQC